MNTTNNQVSKFFNVDTPDTATGGGDSIAALMAKQGSVNNGEVGLTQPINITPEKKDEPTTSTEAPPAATANELPTDAPAKSEPPSQPAEPEKVLPPPIAAEPPKAPTLQEVLKNQQPDTVLKELGYDDSLVKFLSGLKEVDPKVVNFLNMWKEGKDLTGYLREWTTDYNKMSAEDVMRHQLQKDYPKASPQQIDALFKRDVIKAYDLESEDPDLVAEGRLLLEAKAERGRELLIQSQQDFLFPKAPEPKAPEVDKTAQEATQKFDQYHSQFTNNQYTKDIFTNKIISIGDGEEKFNYPVDPQALSDILFKAENWMEAVSETTANPDGTKEYKPNPKHQMLVAAVAKYGENFLIEYAKHYKSLGGKSVNDLLENASKPDGASQSSPAEAAPKTPAEAMARGGRLVN